MMRTYQGRLLPTPDAEVSLDSYAEQYGKAERTQFNKLAAGDDAGKLNSSGNRATVFTTLGEAKPAWRPWHLPRTCMESR
jgi:hypothetical protein